MKTFRQLCGKRWNKSWDKKWSDIQDMFTDGFCYVLAVELAKQYGWEVWYNDSHAIAKRPDSILVDITGEHKNFKSLIRAGRWKKLKEPRLDFWQDVEYRKKPRFYARLLAKALVV